MVGFFVGTEEGAALGLYVGCSVGTLVGTLKSRGGSQSNTAWKWYDELTLPEEGSIVGILVGEIVGSELGFEEGVFVGSLVGAASISKWVKEIPKYVKMTDYLLKVH